jgi:agmatinase
MYVKVKTEVGFRELFTSQSNIFSGFQRSFEEADYVVIGVPFDVTSTYRTGARFGPNAIREASLNIETYSFRSKMDIEDLRMHDAGDLHVSADTSETIERIAKVANEVLEKGKIPVFIGGEHTITFGAVKGLGPKISKTAVISFDAHLDLRDEFMGLKLSHTTFMRRINEQLRPAKIVEVGTRAVCREELDYAEEAKIYYLPAHKIRKEGINYAIKCLKEEILDAESIYLSIDMDVLDPAFAPAVQNPESDGLETFTLLEVLGNLCDKRVIGFDVVEVAPIYDQGVTAIHAAKIIFEVLCNLEQHKFG